MRRGSLRLGAALPGSARALPLPDPALLSDEVEEAAVVGGELRSAVLSRCGRWRYRLTRRWADGPALAFILQNPSRADGREDDQTVRRGRHFAREAGYAALEFVNLWALRCTDSAAFHAAREADPAAAEGPGNRLHLLAAGLLCPAVVCAWGSGGGRAAEDALLRLLAGGVLRPGALLCLGENADGAPVHPSRLGNDRQLRPWDPWRDYLPPF